MDGQVVTDITIASSARLLAIVEKGRRAKWWKRKGSKSRGFKYFDTDGKQIKDEAALERIRLLMEEHSLDFAAAREVVTAGTVFTTHTPVPAGNDVFASFDS